MLWDKRFNGRVLLAFIGSIDPANRWTTIGDVMALYNVAKESQRFIDKLRIAWSGNLFDLDHLKISPEAVGRNDFDAFVYVCGPVHKDLEAALEPMAASLRIAVGVSVIGRSQDRTFWNGLHVRDSAEESSFDLALANIGYPHIDVDPMHRGLAAASCLVGRQREYGDQDGSARALQLVTAALEGQSKAEVQTLVDSTRPNPYAAEVDLQAAKVVVTTRMHGALISLFHGVPVVAIDQIKGGGKVTRMLNSIAYPVLNAWDIEAHDLKTEIARHLAGEPSGSPYRSKIVAESRRSLRDATNLIYSLVTSA